MLTFCIFALANLPALAKPIMAFPFLGPIDDGAGDQCHAEDAVSQCNLAISADGVLMDCRHWCWPALLPEKTAADFDATGCGVRTFGKSLRSDRISHIDLLPRCVLAVYLRPT